MDIPLYGRKLEWENKSLPDPEKIVKKVLSNFIIRTGKNLHF